MRIIPAVLANSLDDFERFIRLAEGFTDYVQLDFMDGAFVPSRSVTIEELAKVKTDLRTEAHLMVKGTERYIDGLKEFGTEKVHFHFEAVSRPSEVIEHLRAAGFSASLAVNPETALDQFEELVGLVDSILFLTVDPGFYGSPFCPEVLDKVREAKARYPALSVGVDGGVKLDNIRLIKEAGADFACVGSAIFNAADPAQSFRDFEREGGA